MYMVMFVLDNPEHLDAVLDAWGKVGVTGVTIVESSGVHRRQAQRARIPFRHGYGQLVECGEEGHYTLFAIVAGDAIARECLAVAEQVVGDLDLPNTGVLAAWPLGLVKGIGGAVAPGRAGQ